MLTAHGIDCMNDKENMKKDIDFAAYDSTSDIFSQEKMMNIVHKYTALVKEQSRMFDDDCPVEERRELEKKFSDVLVISFLHRWSGIDVKFKKIMEDAHGEIEVGMKWFSKYVQAILKEKK